MKLLGSLALLWLALCLGSGTANPLQSGGEGPGGGAAQGVGDAVTRGVEEAVGQGAKEVASSGIQDAFGQKHGGEGSSASRGPRGDAVGYGLGEAVHSPENPGRQAEEVVRRGLDAAHNSGSWGASGGHGILGSRSSVGDQGNPGGLGTPWSSESSFGTNSLGGSGTQGVNGGTFNYETNAQGAVAQPGYGSLRSSNQNSGCTNAPPSGSSGSSNNFGGSSGDGGGSGHGGSGSGHGGSGSSGGSQGGHGGSSSGSRDIETSNFDEGYSVSRGSSSSSGSRGGSSGGNRPECDNPGNDVRVTGGSGSQESRQNGGRVIGGPHDYEEHGTSGDSGRNEAINRVNTNSEKSSLPFNFDNFWENFKSKMGFINWDAIEKGRVPHPSTRALLYFRRLWENFKRSTPFFNWKEIEGSSLQKRAGGTDQFSQPDAGRQEVSAVTSKSYYHNQQVQPTYGWQYYVKTPAKGTVTPSSSASRAQPSLMKWLKFW